MDGDGMGAVTVGKRDNSGIRLFLVGKWNGEKTCHNNCFKASKKLIELDVMELINVLKEPIK